MLFVVVVVVVLYKYISVLVSFRVFLFVYVCYCCCLVSLLITLFVKRERNVWFANFRPTLIYYISIVLTDYIIFVEMN